MIVLFKVSEKQRLNVACHLLLDTDIVLLDQPTEVINSEDYGADHDRNFGAFRACIWG